MLNEKLYTIYSDKGGQIQYITSFKNEEQAKDFIKEDEENYYYIEEEIID